MKRMFFITIIITAVSAAGQGTFQNLDFESARVVFTNGLSAIVVSNAFPNWSVFVGTNQLAVLPLDIGGMPPVELLYSNAHYVPNGNFAVALQDSSFGSTLPAASGPGSISQTGLVPTDAESLLFAMVPFGEGISVSLGGQNLSYIAISNLVNSAGLNYTVYGANISAFAGQTETLTFTAFSGEAGYLDDIQFSSQPVPEPGMLSLIRFGSGILLYVIR